MSTLIVFLKEIKHIKEKNNLYLKTILRTSTENLLGAQQYPKSTIILSVTMLAQRIKARNVIP
jgi:hypothetical protein